MNITCPRCGFSRQVPANRLPARAVIATCPQCACRFRFAPDTGVQDILPDAPQAGVQDQAQGQVAAPAPHDHPNSDDFRGSGAEISRDPSDSQDPGEDDPLPPGAIVPGSPAWSRDEAAQKNAPARENVNSNEDQGNTQPRTREAWRNTDKPGTDRPKAEKADDYDDDPRAEASRAYEREQHRRYGEDDSSHGRKRPAADTDPHADDDAHDGYDEQYDEHAEGIPWETAPEPDGWLAAFYQTCMRVMFGAQRVFSHVQPGSSQMRALIFYLLVSVIQVIVERVWSGVFMSLIAPSAASDPQLEKMLVMLSPQMSLPMVMLVKTGMSVIQLYVLSALINFTYGFVRGSRTDFSQVFQVLAYSAAPTLLCVVPLLGSLVGFVWMVACVLVGCRAALRLTWPQTLMGLAPVILLIAPLILQIFQAARV
ncbi:MAG: YIP1 family protein [Desulfovibrio sp.]|nr:YIP1 family protein [Desulfovibrio sp.]